MNAPLQSDVVARSARERVELAAAQRDGSLAIEACDMLTELFSAGYRLFPLADSAATPARPVRMRARYDGLCASCGAPISVDQAVWWRRDAQGVECNDCGARP